MKKGKRITALLVAVLLSVTLIPYFGGTESAQAADDGKAAYDEVMRVEEPDTYKDQSYEPYGYGEDVPFMMNKQSELLFYQTSPDSSGDITTFYDTLKTASDGDVLGGTKTSALKAPPTKLKQAYFVQAVAFDPTGSGRDDHIAFIGIYHDGSKARCYVWAYNTRNRTWTSEFNLGTFDDATCTWMESEHVTDYQGVHFLSITAGDYDADGIDSLVAFASFNGINGYDQFELVCQYPGFKIAYRNSKNPETWGMCHDKYTDALAKLNTIESRMGLELDTGDINGDGIDDLVSVAYIGEYEDKALTLETYRPAVKISFGEPGKESITRDYKTVEAWSWDEGWWWDSMISPGLSVGDVDNDGKDEIVTAGIYCPMKKKSETTSERIHDDIDLNKQFTCIIGVNESNKLEREYTGILSTNAWTQSGFYPGDDIWNKLAVQCAAINGPGNAELIFIGGTLYTYDSKNNRLTAAYTPEYFQNDGDNLSSKASSNMFIQSTAAGNFDGNSKGYEQIAFTVSCKTKDKRSYDYLRGVVGGKNYNNTTGQAGGYYSTAKSKMNDDYAWPGRGKDNASGYTSEHQGLNCIVVAADNDNDGVLARYKEKALLYSDPEVLCVLQAPPYFEEVKDYLTDTSETAYEISDIFSFEKGTSDSVSFGVGVVAGMESPAMQMELTAGYALDWTKEFTEGLEENVTLGWKAKEEDIVLVQRKPVVSYYYEIQSKTGEWSGEHMVITVPCEPDLVTMGIDKYNAFATYYNRQLENSQFLKDFQKKSDISDVMKTTHKLDLLNNEWLGHEGDPEGYIKWTNSKFRTDSRYRILQSKPMKLGHNSESVSWGKTSSNSVGVTESMSHGSTYDATIAMGPNVGAASLYVGLTTSLQYMTGESTTTTQTKEQGISCEINGLKVKDMPAEMRGDDYNFSFKMARWPSGMKHYVNGVAEDIPVYGYALSSVTKPNADTRITVEDQLKAAEVTEMISEIPMVEEITVDNEAAVNEVRAKYDALTDPAKTLVNAREIEELESRIELLKAGGMDLSGADVKLSKASFTYNGTVQKPAVLTINGLTLKEGLDYTAKWSNASSKNAGVYTVTINGTGLCSGSASVTYKIAKAANPLKIKAKTATVKYSKLKKKAQTLKVSKVITFTKKGQGTLSYKKSSGNKKITINSKTGKVTVKKGLKKGTYKIKVKVRASGNANYNASSWNTVTFKIKVK